MADSSIGPDTYQEFLAQTDPDPDVARSRVFGWIYDELRTVAAKQIRGGFQVSPTSVVSEFYMKLKRCNVSVPNTRSEFLAFAATAMRRLIIDHLRASNRRESNRVPLDSVVEDFKDRAIDLVALDAALDELRESRPDDVEIVELRFFAGLSMQEIAEVLEISLRTLERRWQWIRHRLQRMIS